MSRALDCPQTLRLQSAQCGMTTARRSSPLELHNKPSWNRPVCTVGRWHVSPCKTASLIMEERQRGAATTIRPVRKPHIHLTPRRPRRRSDIRSNFLLLVLDAGAVVSAICQLIQRPLMILHHCPLRAKEAAFEINRHCESGYAKKVRFQ